MPKELSVTKANSVNGFHCGEYSVDHHLWTARPSTDDRHVKVKSKVVQSLSLNTILRKIAEKKSATNTISNYIILVSLS